jgi:hypothetical protein
MKPYSKKQNKTKKNRDKTRVKKMRENEWQFKTKSKKGEKIIKY